MGIDKNTMLVSERYNHMIDAIEAYVQAEKMATRHFMESKAATSGPLVVSVTGATEADEYNDCDNNCEHCACKGEN